MGKARALKLGIIAGVEHVAKVALPSTWKCPICKYQFNAYDVAVEAKETGRSAEEIVAEHIKSCISSRFPGSKSECWECKRKGKTTMLKISELDAHIEKEHSEK